MGGLGTITRESSSAVVSHYNVAPVIDLYGTPQDRDLGAISSDIDDLLAATAKDLPRGVTVHVRGQVVTQAVAGLLVLRVQRNLRMARAPAVAVFDQIGRDGVEPRRKLLARVKLRAVLIHAHERFLGEVGGLILGLPVNMDGSEGPRCQSVRQFAANLLGRFQIPIAFWDERLSTAAVTRAMLEADLSRRKRASLVDKMAAAYILQGALDAMGRQPA